MSIPNSKCVIMKMNWHPLKAHENGLVSKHMRDGQNYTTVPRNIGNFMSLSQTASAQDLAKSYNSNVSRPSKSKKVARKCETFTMMEKD